MKFSPEQLSPKAEKKEKILKEKMSKEAVFVEKEGVAHMGPEFFGIESDDIKEINPETGNYEEEPGLVLKEKIPSHKELKKPLRNTGEEKDNLKTIPESEKERNKREKIRKALGK